ncbi:uncharacterized protein C3orf20 homolog isoform X1 [Coturnix japonica]|uniref:FAM194 C-terminal domain-containing protein n=2 Tax=Coturnix japonica TaxID=93934 RepID=A0A8C2T0Q6_COTJA|nr:uncharacterized protein C3orf20 homolog isoform X1 [Coturnix japonica]
MEPVLTAAVPEAGPIYFFDQMKARMKERDKEISEVSSYCHMLTTNPHPISFTPSLTESRNPFCAEKYTERHEDGFLNDDMQKDPVLHQMSRRSLCKTTTEDSNPKISQCALIPQADKDSPLNTLNKSASANMLQELGEKLQLLAGYQTGLPPELVNVLTCSWRELTEGADCCKRQQKMLSYKSMRSRRSQASEEVKNSILASERKEHEITDIRKEQHKKDFTLPACTTKRERNPEMASNTPPESEAPVVQNDADQSPITVNFSLSSNTGEEQGLTFQLSDSKSEDVHQDLPYMWTPERPKQVQNQIKEQASNLKEVGSEKPIILRHYGDYREETFPRTRKVQAGRTVTSELPYDEAHFPVVKSANTAQRKLHYRLNDGSSFIYYPSEHLAVCQSCCNLPCGGMYTNIFSPSPDHSIVGTFTPFGHGSIYLPNSNTVTMMFNQEGGLVTNKDEETVREWKWPRDGKLAQPVIAQVNEFIAVRIAGRFAISLVYKWQHESVCLSLSPPRGAALPQLEESSKRTELLWRNEVLEATISHVNDISATRELRHLQKKIWSVVVDWLQYYQRALGIGCTRIRKISDRPLRPLRKGTIQSADSLPVTFVMQRSQGKRKENSQAPKSECPLPDQMRLTLPSGMQQEPHSYPYRSALLNSNIKTERLHTTQLSLSKRRNVLNVSNSRNKLWVTSQMACPAVLRRVVTGEEGKTCRCSNHRIPCVTDLEYDHLINNIVAFKEQITVVCVSSSQRKDPSEDEIEQLYERQNKHRSMPCAQGCLDSFRLLKYNITSADAFTDHKGSLLEKRHNVAPGMFLMYIQGKLLFANYIFNGYSKSTKDLQKQIAKTRNDYRMGYSLPADFRFRNGCLFNSTN